MSFERQFILAGRGLVLTGVTALAITGAVGIAYLVIAIAVIAWSGVQGWRGRGFELSSRIANTVALAALAMIFAPVLFGDASLIEPIAEFLLVLTAFRILAARTGRDWLQIYALSFFELVAASALTVEPAFAVLFLVYLVLAPWALVLLFLRTEMTAAGQGRRLLAEPFVDPSLFRGVATVTVLLFFSTLLVFVFFPRMGAGYFANPLVSGLGLTGFADEVGLGDVTALRQSSAVAMRVAVDRPERIRETPSYWRGSALDSFDGRRWTRSRHELRPLLRGGPGMFLVGEGGRPRDVLRQEVILEPMEHPTLLFLGRPLHLEGRFSALMIDLFGNLRTLVPPGSRLRYEVLSSLTPRTSPPPPTTLDLPELDPRIRALVASRVGGLSSDDAKARGLMDFLRKGFGYTTEPGDPGAADPLSRFLFETRQGHCEYFASSLAILLRVAGIPTLVVNGYLGGEWNPYGEYFLIRQSDAHSWVEAYIDGEWRTLDPTPPAGRPSPRGIYRDVTAAIDAMRMRWYRYVVNYGLADQVEIAFSLRDSSRRLWRGISGEYWRDGLRALMERRRGESTPNELPLAAALVAAAALGLALVLRRRARASREAAGWATTRYLECLRLLERRGLRKRPADTPDEFYEKIAPRLDGDREVVARLTALYQEARFSGRDAEQRRDEIDALVAKLAQRT